MLVPVVVILEAFVEGFAVVAVVLWILGLLFEWGWGWFLDRCAFGLGHAIYRKTRGLDFLLDELQHLGFEVL